MDLNLINNRIIERQKTLIEIKKIGDPELQMISQDLQQDYQNLFFLETQTKDQSAKKTIIDLRKKVVEQQDLIKAYLKIRYGRLVNKSMPKIPVIKNALIAFGVGGTICAIAQVILNSFMLYGIASKEAATFTTITMVFLGALLTGLGIYDEIGRFGGAGSMVPITGFANSIVSPALEYKREGYVYGVGAKIFTIAGPVLLYGSLISVVIGLIFYIMK